jgi:non-heme chloroperoxidase
MRLWLKLLIAFLALAGLALGGAILFGTSPAPAELTSISDLFRQVDLSDLPPVRTLEVKHGSPVAYRVYGEGEKGVTIAIHGSSALGASLHPLARGLAAAGQAVYVPDLRGHGATGRRGDVDFIGQPDLDLLSLILLTRKEHPGRKLTLVGFSLGGGFLIRFVGAYPALQPDRTVLLAPALGPEAESLRSAESARWAAAHGPRIVALTILNFLGFAGLNELEAIRFAVPPNSERYQTAAYTFRLYASLMPLSYTRALGKTTAPLTVLIGETDELFNTSSMRASLAGVHPKLDVTVVPGVGHVGLTLDPVALPFILDALAKP